MNGTIAEVVRKQNRSNAIVFSLVVVVCLVTLGFHWKYLVNIVQGPKPFSAALAASPGGCEWVTVKGELLPSGVTEESVLKIKGLPLNKSVSAKYMSTRVDGRLLIVKVTPDFSGNRLDGRLEPLTKELATSLSPSDGYYPWMVSATTGYRWDFSLIFLGALLAFPLAALMLLESIRTAADITRHPAIKDLGRFGPPLTILGRAEAEAARATDADKLGPLTLTPSWLISADPLLNIVAAEEIAAMAMEKKFAKSGEKHFVLIWRRGKPSVLEIEMVESCAIAVLNRTAALYPWIALVSPSEYRNKWVLDRAGCEKELVQRLSTAGKKPSPAR